MHMASHAQYVQIPTNCDSDFLEYASMVQGLTAKETLPSKLSRQKELGGHETTVDAQSCDPPVESTDQFSCNY